MSLRPARRVRALERTLIRQIFDEAPKGAINLGLGEPDLPTPPGVRIAGVAAIAEGRTGYTSTAGDPQLRAAVARRYAGFVSGPEGILITVGSQEAMFASCLALVDPGDEILYPDPGYPAYPVVARLVGAEPVAYPLRRARGFRLSAEDVTRRLTERTRLVILCSPSNPTGAVNAVEELQPLLRALEHRKIAWLSDEIYAAFRYETTVCSPSELSPQGGVVVSGLSKEMSMTGWRVGWIAGPSEIVTRAIAAHQYLVTCAPGISQRSALAALGPRGESERAAYLDRFRRRRSVMARELSAIPGVSFRVPEGAFYFFVDVSRYGKSLELSRRILSEQNVVTIPGVAFGNEGEGYLRLSFAATENAIVEGVQRIGKVLQGAG